MISTFAALKRLSDRLGPMVGNEAFGPFLYALARMQRPSCVVEIGTGAGVATFWLAQALAENGHGRLHTIDDGSAWQRLVSEPRAPLKEGERRLDQQAFVRAKLDELGLGDRVTLLSRTVPPFPDADGPIDLLYADFRHDPEAVLRLLAHYLPRMAPAASIFVDSASTHFASYALLELLARHLGEGRVPATLRDLVEPGKRGALEARVRRSRLTLIHLTKSGAAAQNSVAWLKLEPLDLRAHPPAPFH